MILRKKSVYFFLVLIVGLILFSSALALKINFIGMTFFINSVQSLFFLAIIGGSLISLIKIYFIFVSVFLSIIPWIHYNENLILWGGGVFRDSNYGEVNIYIFISNFFVALIYSIKYKKYSKQSSNIKFESKILNENILCLTLIILSTLAFFSLLALNNFNFFRLFFRGLLNQDAMQVVDSSSLAILFTMVSRLIPFFCFLFVLTKVRKNFLSKAILFILLIFCAFPTGIPRYMVGFVYIPILLIFFKKLRGAIVFTSLLISSILFIFPFLDQFRLFESGNKISIIPSKDFFFAGHFDAYQNFARAVQIDMVTYGYQFIGVLLFYVPRIFWPTKPVGSGYEMAEIAGYNFNNISMPFIGEGYVNFGIFGIFIFTGLLSFAMAKVDGYFCNQVGLKETLKYSGAIYFYMLGALFFILRGDLLSSTAYFSAGLFCAWFVLRVSSIISVKM